MLLYTCKSLLNTLGRAVELVSSAIHVEAEHLHCGGLNFFNKVM